MKYSAKFTLTALGCLASGVLGHGQVQNFTINGVYNQGFIRMSPFFFQIPESQAVTEICAPTS